MTEEQFRQQIRGLARMCGWSMQYHTHDSRRSDPGWPDEVFHHPKHRRTIFAELKSDKGRLSAAQHKWLEALSASGLETALWKPANLSDITKVLGPAQRISSYLDHFNAVHGDS